MDISMKIGRAVLACAATTALCGGLLFEAQGDDILPKLQMDSSGNLKVRGGPVLGAWVSGVWTAVVNYTAPFGHAVPVSQKLQNGGVVSPLSWGADPTCTSDSTSAFTNMFADIGPGMTVDIGYGCYRVGGVTQPPNTTIRGAMGYGDPFLSSGTNISTTATAASSTAIIPVASATGIAAGQLVFGPGIPAGTTVVSVSGTNVTVSQTVSVAGAAAVTFVTVPGGVQTNPYTWGGEIRRIQGTTYTASNGDKFSNLVFIREGLLPGGVTFPLQNVSQANAVIANFGDNAIQSDQASIEVEHSTFLGFTYPLYATNSGGVGISNKVRFEYNLVDSLYGPYLASSGDPHRVSNNHIFPFLTIAAPGVGTLAGQSLTPMQRAGVGIYLQGPDTGSTVVDNLTFGYAIGTQCSACAAITYTRNHFENIGAGEGMSLQGEYMKATDNFVVGYTYPVYFDALQSPTGTETNPSGNDNAELAGNQIIGPSGAAYCVNHVGGWVNAHDNLFENCPDAVHIQSAATGGFYSRNRNVGVTTPFVFYNSSSAVVSSYAGSGSLVIKDNPGYNPVGPKTVTVTTGTFTYNAGNSPETVYLWAGTVSSLVVNGRGIFVNPTGQTIELAPSESMSITSSAAPTMISDVH